MRSRDLSNAVVVSPDVGSADEASAYANRLDLPQAIMDKRRHADDEKAEIQNIIGDIEGRDALLFDDEVLTGGSMMEAMRILRIGVLEEFSQDAPMVFFPVQLWSE